STFMSMPEPGNYTKDDGKNTVENNVDPLSEKTTVEWVLSNDTPASAASGGYLARPSNIYAEPETEPSHSEPVKEQVSHAAAEPEPEEEPSTAMQLVFKDETPLAADEPRAHQTPEI